MSLLIYGLAFLVSGFDVWWGSWRLGSALRGEGKLLAAVMIMFLLHIDNLRFPMIFFLF
jgi:hypothetical protein